MEALPKFKPVALESIEERVNFIRRTYFHLGLAVMAFTIIEIFLIPSAFTRWFLNFSFSGRLNWLLVLGAFLAVGWVANYWAHSQTSPCCSI